MEDDWDDDAFDDWRQREDERALSAAGIAEQNAGLLGGYRNFRLAADAVVAAWRTRENVAAISLIGAVAVNPWKEVPRFSPYRRTGIALWHECKDLDLAVWLTRTDGLNELRRAKDEALRELFEKTGIGVASHQADVFVLAAATDRYLGRLCAFNDCPKAKNECRVAGCGATPFLRQHQDFEWRKDSIAPERSVRLFERASDLRRDAADLPLPNE